MVTSLPGANEVCPSTFLDGEDVSLFPFESWRILDGIDVTGCEVFELDDPLCSLFDDCLEGAKVGMPLGSVDESAFG